MANVILPYKDLRELAYMLNNCSSLVDFSLTYICDADGREITVGGKWDRIAQKYAFIYSGTERSQRIWKLGVSQFDALEYAIESLYNPEKIENGKPPITTIVVHAPRRGGKSYGLAAIFSAIMIAKPHSKNWLIGLLLKHGTNIIATIKKYLGDDLYKYDDRKSLITMVNGSTLRARPSQYHNKDRGDSLDCIGIDEAAFMRPDVYESAVPAIMDRAGICILASSPNMLNYFYRLAEQATKEGPASAVVKAVHLKPEHNVFVPYLAKMKEFLKYSMSAEGYQQEALGAFINYKGRVLPHFDKKLHVVSADHMQDCTAAFINSVAPNYGDNRNYIVGVDYNVNPTAGAILKVSTEGHIYYIDEVVSADGTEYWGDKLYDTLLRLGAVDPYQEALIVGDASGEYQDPRDKKNLKSAEILRQQGWLVIRPQHYLKVNPSVLTRMEIMRSLHYNAAQQIRMFVDPRCTELINSFNELPLKSNGKPDKNHRLNHIYDGASYPVFRIWGTNWGTSYFKKPLVFYSKNLNDYDPDAEDEMNMSALAYGY